MSKSGKIFALLALLLVGAALVVTFVDFGGKENKPPDNPDVSRVANPDAKPPDSEPTPLPTPTRADGASSETAVLSPDEVAAFDGPSTLPLWGVAGDNSPMSGEYFFGMFSAGRPLVKDKRNEYGREGMMSFTIPMPAAVEAAKPNPRALSAGRLLFHHEGKLEAPAFYIPLFGGMFWDTKRLEPLNEAARENLRAMEADPSLRAQAGSVVDGEGRPIPGARIVAMASRRQMPVGVARGGADGGFVLSLMPAGQTMIMARAPGYRAGDTQTVELAAGIEAAPITIVLEKGAAFVGRVTNEGDQGLAGVTVNAILNMTGKSRQNFASMFHSAQTDSQGVYMIDSVEPGSYTFQADHPEYAMTLVEKVELAETESVKKLDIVMGSGGSVQGRVVQKVNGEDAGVEGAEVMLPGGRLAPGGRKVLTDADGSFKLDHIPYDRPTYINARKGALNAHLPGGVTIKKGETPEPVVLRLPETVELVGYTLDENDKPVAGAQVGVTEIQNTGGGGYYFNQQALKELKSVSDARGEFRIPGIPADHTINLRAEAEGYATPDVANVSPKALEDVEIRMTRGGKIAGRVVISETGEGLGGVSLFLRRENMNQGQPFTAKTDSDGAFVFKNLMAGSYSITEAGDAEKQTEYAVEQLDNIVLEAGAERSDIEIKAVKGLTLKGRVLMLETNEPVANANINTQWWLRSEGRNPNGGWAQTPGDGSFVLRGLSPGLWRVSAQKQGALKLSIPQDAMETPEGKFSEAIVKLEAGAEPEELVLYVIQGGTVKGLVLNSEGLPVKDVLLQCSLKNENSSHRLWELGFYDHQTQKETDAEGRFEIQGIPLNGMEFVVKIVRGGPAAQSEPFALSADKPEAEVTIRLPLAGSISGRVTDSEGKPVQRQHLYAQKKIGENQYENHVFCNTDGDGAYKLENLAAGTYSIFMPNDRGESGLKVESVELAEGEQKTGVDFVHDTKQQEESEKRSFKGILTDFGTNRLSSWQVSLEVDKNQKIELRHNYITTAHDGSFVFPDVPDGRYRIRFSSNSSFYSCSIQSGVFEATRETVIFVAPMGGKAKGRLVDKESGRPIPDGRVYMNFQRKSDSPKPEGSDLVVEHYGVNRRGGVDKEGRFEIADLPIGTFELNAQSESAWLEKPFPFQMDTSLVADIGDVPMEAAFSIQARLIDGSTGKPLVLTANSPFSLGVSAVFGENNRQRGLSCQGPDADGKIKASGLPWGATKIRLTTQYYVALEVEIPETGRSLVDLGDLTLDPGITLRGKIQGPNGEKVNTGSVNMRMTEQRNDSYRYAHIQAGNEGRFELRGLSPGKAKINADAYSHDNEWIPRGKNARAQELEIEIVDGVNPEILITLQLPGPDEDKDK